MLLEQTLRRIALLVSLDRTVAIVVLAHERFYASLLADFPSRCMAIPPENRDPPCRPSTVCSGSPQWSSVSCKSGSHCRSTYCENEEGLGGSAAPGNNRGGSAAFG